MVDGGPPMPLMPGDGKRGNLVILEPELSLRSSRCDTVYPEERGSDTTGSYADVYPDRSLSSANGQL
jgi:hypothetical protein